MHLAQLHFQGAVTTNSLRRNYNSTVKKGSQRELIVPPTGQICAPIQEKVTYRKLAAVVGSPVDPGTAVGEGSPAAGEGLAGMLPAVDHTGHYLQGATAGNVSNMLTTTAQQQRWVVIE